ncbi:MAG: acylglycerol kinase family protein [Spirochaetes bacterium]|nr:acylglycerol kinase family protein [Spirochaetota bacterium]
MAKIGIIINPHAKKNKKMKQNLADLFHAIGGNLVEVRVTQSLDEIFTVAEEFQKKNIDYLAVCGGDGTLHHVLSRFILVYRTKDIPPLVILKGGTMDTISRSINLKGKGPDILKRLVDTIIRRIPIRMHYRNTMKIGDKYGFLFGLGITSNFLVEYYRGGNTGPWKAIKVTIGGIIKGIFHTNAGLFKRLSATVTIDGNELPFKDYLGILAATVENIGIGFRTLSRAYEKEYAFHVLASAMKPIDIVPRIWYLKTGKKINHPLHFDDVASTILIRGPRTFQYMVDGDLYEATDELKVEAGPRVRIVEV